MAFPDYNRNYDAELYDIECHHADMGDLQFLRELCGQYGGPVLEVCVGTGRVAIPLAYDGLKVTGLDISNAMLERFREKLDVAPVEVRKRITIIKDDMRKFDVGKKFRTVFIAFNSFLALTKQEDQIACLHRIRDHMQPGKGRFILDVFNPSMEHLTRDPKQKIQEHIYTDENTGITHELMTTIRYDDASQVSNVTIYRTHLYPDGTMKREIQELKMRMIFPEELMLLLDHCGFKLLHRWGNYRKEKFGTGMMKQLIVAKIK